jgi:hypothetical protein
MYFACPQSVDDTIAKMYTVAFSASSEVQIQSFESHQIDYLFNPYEFVILSW